MIITCPFCRTRYRVEASQFGPTGRRVRCTSCSHVWAEHPAEDLPKAIDPDPRLPPETAEDLPQEESQEETSAAAEDAAAPAEPVGERPGPDDRGRGDVLGWALFAALVISILTGGYLGRQAVVAAWPATERLYRIAGLMEPIPHPGLRISVKSHLRSMAEGSAFVTVSGEVANLSRSEKTIPGLRAYFRAADTKILAFRDFTVERDRLGPGQSAEFAIRYDNPPRAAAALEIDFKQ